MSEKKDFLNDKILIIGKVWPEPDSSAAGTRMMELVDFFRSYGANVTFATAAAESKYAVDLEAIGVETAQIKLNHLSFDTFVFGLDPSLVLFDRFMTEEQFGWRVAEQCPKAIRVLDTEDLHCLRSARQQAWKKGAEFKESDVLNDVAKREVASILRCDLSLMISSYEMYLLKEVFGVDESLILHLPFMLKRLGADELNKWLAYDKRKHFITIGNFLHEPNWNAVLYLKEKIWPLIHTELPGTELHVYGAYASPKVEQLHNEKQGFIVKGRAENAMEVVGNARVLLAPIRFGAGLKGKLIEAMLCGTPSITTSVGAEAMSGELPWPGQVEDDPELFARAAIHAYKNPEYWEDLRNNGPQIIDSMYSKEMLSIGLKERINCLKDNLQLHRQQNFIGSILQHHMMLSTRYMSKWIETKNSNGQVI